MISNDQDNSRETLSFHRSEFLFLQRKQIAFPIDLSPGRTGPILILNYPSLRCSQGLAKSK